MSRSWPLLDFADTTAYEHYKKLGIEDDQLLREEAPRPWAEVALRAPGCSMRT